MKWRYETGVAYKGNYHIVIDDEHGDMVCECYEGEEDAQAERAKLIAMTPDLLEALETVLMAHKAQGGLTNGDAVLSVQIEKMVEHTIKKARGM